MMSLQCEEDYRTQEDLLLWNLRNLGSQVGMGHSGFISICQDMRIW